MTRYVPSLRSIMETLRLAEQGYLVDDARPRPAVRPMPWRRILHHLIAMGRGDVLQVEPTASGAGGDDTVVRRIAGNRRPAPKPGAAHPAKAAASRAGTTVAAVSADARLRTLSRFAQSIETAVQRSQCRVTCVKTNSDIRAYMTGPAESPSAAPTQFSFANRLEAACGQGTSARVSDPTHPFQIGGMSK